MPSYIIKCLLRNFCLRGFSSLSLCIFLGAFDVNAHADVLHVSIANSSPVNPLEPSYYFEQLLTLALEKTRITDGDFVIEHNPGSGGAERVRAKLVAGVGIDVMWSTATLEREKTMRVVSIDLFNHLNNYRALLIHKEDQPAFSNIKSLQDLQKFSVGSGTHWSDTAILKANGMNVTTAVNYTELTKMLVARRFNFLTLGLYEASYELSKLAEFNLVLAPKLILRYNPPSLYCFFVRKDNIQLADRIKRGLEIAIADHSFDKLFFSVDSFRAGMNVLNSPDRTIIDLKNVGDNSP